MRLRFTVEYHGAPFAGFARNVGVDTVAGRLEDAFSRVLRTAVVVSCAGRTDRGVHATGQVITVDVPSGTDVAGLTRRVNSIVGPHVAVRDAEAVATDFDARFSARSRRYQYTIWNADTPAPLLGDRSWHVADRLELAPMRQAASALVGRHDFSSLCRRPPGSEAQEPLVREVLAAEWSGEAGALVTFDIIGAAFCHQMVRSAVGLCVEIGRGRRRAGDVLGILRARNRAASAPIAPPQGLCLIEVRY